MRSNSNDLHFLTERVELGKKGMHKASFISIISLLMLSFNHCKPQLDQHERTKAVPTKGSICIVSKQNPQLQQSNNQPGMTNRWYYERIALVAYGLQNLPAQPHMQRQWSNKAELLKIKEIMVGV